MPQDVQLRIIEALSRKYANTSAGEGTDRG